jgi:hypothetical protein
MNSLRLREIGLWVVGPFVLLGCQQPSMNDRGPRQASVSDRSMADGPQTANSKAPEAARPPTDPQPTTSRRIIAYYFHRTLRCPTCLAIEKQAKEAIESRFSSELAAGLIEWRSLNIDEPANQHFEVDYALTAQSLVFVEMSGDRQLRWTNLTRVWDLVEKPAEFRQYVVEEMQGNLSREHPAGAGT